jgi:hypothetical protein
MQRVISVVLVLLIALVGWRVYETWSATRTDAEPEGRTKGADNLDLPSTARTPPPPRLAAAIAERDLFDESRKAPTAEVKTAEPVPPPNVELVGVFIMGPEPEALINDTGPNGGLRHVFKGDDVGGYTVSAISATEVVLTSPQGEEVPLTLEIVKSAAPPPAGGTAGAAAAARKGAAEAAARANAAGNEGRAPAGGAPGVRDRLRELRRQRREQNKAQQ